MELLLRWWKLPIHTLIIGIGCLGNGFSQDISSERVLLNKIRNEKNEEQQFDLQLQLGSIYKINQLSSADSLKHVLLKESRSLTKVSRLKALIYSCEVNQLIGNQQEYETDVVSLKQYIHSCNDLRIKFKIHLYLSEYYSSRLEFNDARTQLEKAKKIARKIRNNAIIAESHNGFAYFYMLQNRKDSALLESNRAIQYSRRTSDQFIAPRSINLQARIYQYFGQPELSVAKNIIALQLATENNDLYSIAKLNREIGTTQLEIYDLNGAEGCFNNSIEASRIIEDERQLGLALNELGMVYFYRKRSAEAIQTISIAIGHLQKKGDNAGLGISYNNLGIIHRERKEYSKAAKKFNEALVLFETVGDRENIATVYHNIGTVFEKQGKHKNALTYLNRSIEIRKQFGSKSQIYPTYRVISNVYKGIGNTNQAFFYMQMYLDFIDSNTTLQAAKKIAEMSESYRADQRKKLIEQQAHSIEVQRKERIITSTKLEYSYMRNRYQAYFIIGLVLLIVLAIVLVFFRWNQTKIRQKQKEAEMSQTLLRAQMNPHFVFNAMSVIQSYIYENDTVNSSKFLVNFSRLMRLILENSSKDFISLDTEMDILQKYLETQKLRFEQRFNYEIHVGEDISTDFAMIPPMITQPFIENAIEHGQLHTIPDGGWIKIAFERINNQLRITITDNGIGRKGAESNKKARNHKSMAMKITRERIENINYKFKSDGFLQIEDFDKSNQTGTKVLISLPYNEDKSLSPEI